jgi:hypothetical protein
MSVRGADGRHARDRGETVPFHEMSVLYGLESLDPKLIYKTRSHFATSPLWSLISCVSLLNLVNLYETLPTQKISLVCRTQTHL